MIPRLMNCEHQASGWCLECVNKGLLDAVIAGERIAAEKISNYTERLNMAIAPLSNGGDYEAQWYVRAVNDCKQAILTDANNRTELP